jgi:hypothetical protein
MDEAADNPRLAIILNGAGKWFVREIGYVVQDDVRGEMVYHCTRHIGGPFATVQVAVACAESELNTLQG